MASVVQQFPTRHRGRPPIYDWEKYGDGQTWVCRQGVDFETSPTSFRALVHRTANARGMKAETTINKYDKSVTFRFTEAP
jgi:hypothetical protein